VKETFALVNQMQTDGIIGKYAVGGAVGATFYLEPSATLGIDIFVSLQSTPGSVLLSLTPVYEYLIARGCGVEQEHIIIAGWPVQFLPPADALDAEALAQAVATEVDGIKVWVMTAEHLVAIALRTGRSKDFVRILQFVESGAIESNKLDDLLARHGLLEKWERFGDKFLGDKP
jgi:hypothetical protein